MIAGCFLWAELLEGFKVDSDSPKGARTPGSQRSTRTMARGPCEPREPTCLALVFRNSPQMGGTGKGFVGEVDILSCVFGFSFRARADAQSIASKAPNNYCQSVSKGVLLRYYLGILEQHLAGIPCFGNCLSSLSSIYTVLELACFFVCLI